MLDGLVLSSSHRASLNRAVTAYAQAMTGHDPAACYLAARGVTEDAARGFRLGLVDEPLPGHERFHGWLAVPYLTVAGPVAIKFRDLDPDTRQKYDAPAGQRAHLYNAGALAGGGDVVVVCEGELDAVVATSALQVPAVGTPGTTWLSHWSRCFADVERVIVVADNDDKAGGSNPGRRHAEKVQKAISGAQLVLPPLGLDLGEWVAQEGAESVREALLA